MIGAVLGGWFQDRFGRRLSLATASIVAAMGIAIMFACFASEEILTRRALFLAGKLVQGLGIGMVSLDFFQYSILLDNHEESFFSRGFELVLGSHFQLTPIISKRSKLTSRL